MKIKFIALVTLIGLLFGTFIQAQTVDEIISKHIQAIGGADKISKLQSIIIDAKVNAGNGMEIPITLTRVHNMGMRMEINVMGMTGWVVMRPDSGWVFMPFQGQTQPEAMPQDALKEGVDQLDVQSELFNYKEKGHEISYLGMDDVEGTECYKLKVVSKNGNTNYYLIDPSSHYLVKSVSKRKAGGQEMEVESFFSNYKEVDGGYVFAHTITSQMGPMEIVKFTINSEVPKSKFTGTN